MALVNGNDYDHIDLQAAAGGDVTRHMLKDAKAREDVSALKSAIEYQTEALEPIITNGELLNKSNLENGGLTNSGTNATAANRVRSVRYISVIPGGTYHVEIRSAYELGYNLSYYATNGSVTRTERIENTDIIYSNSSDFTVPNNSSIKFARFLLRKSDNGALTVNDIDSVHVVIPTYGATKAVELSGKVYDILSDWVQGALTDEGLNSSATSSYNVKRLRTRNYFEIPSNNNYVKAEFSPSSTDSIAFNFFTVADYKTPRISSSGFVKFGQWVDVPSNARYMRLIFKHNDESNITPDYIQSNILVTSGAYMAQEEDIKTQRAGDFVIDSSLTKKPVTVAYLGNLVNTQSFCYYDGKYYCPNRLNNTLDVLDENFTVLQTVSLNLDHANAIHTGAAYPNYGYVSGWDTQKVYVVDLDNLTIVNTINLPTTGYTTCAVDDVNGIMYIFQRDTASSAGNDFYNFIVYDYVNAEIVSSKKTYISYSAMQGVDFVCGKIIVPYGLGADTISTIPHGMFVCDTSATILEEYHLQCLDQGEPESACWDEANMRLLVSVRIGNEMRLFSITRFL